MKTENTHLDYYNGKEQRTLNGCRTGFLIALFGALLFTAILWYLTFQILK